MHDIRQIRDNPAAFDDALARRGEEAWSEDILAIDLRRREAIQEAEAAQAARNRASKEVGAAKARGDEAEFQRLRQLMADKKQEQAELEEKARIEQAQLDQILLTLPNSPRGDVPDGADETENVELKRWGSIPNFAFDPKEH
ncbi:MAG: serine--tRNA ligase, partial [Pseudomonadota bacterium]